MTNTIPRTVSPLDIIIIISLIACACSFYPFAASHRPSTVVVFRDNQCIARYPLSENRIFSIMGKSGNMSLCIQANSVRVIASSCPRGICMATGAIVRHGQQIVCAPNHILVELETPSGISVDAVTQ